MPSTIENEILKSKCNQDSVQLTVSFQITNIGFSDLTDSLQYKYTINSKYFSFISIKLSKNGIKGSKTKVFVDPSGLKDINLASNSLNTADDSFVEKDKNSEIINDNLVINEVKKMTADILEFKLILKKDDLTNIDSILTFYKVDEDLLKKEDYRDYSFFFDIVNFHISKKDFKTFNISSKEIKKNEVRAQLPNSKVGWIILGAILFIAVILLICKVLLDRVQKTLFNHDEDDVEGSRVRPPRNINLQNVYEDFVYGRKRDNEIEQVQQIRQIIHDEDNDVDEEIDNSRNILH